MYLSLKLIGSTVASATGYKYNGRDSQQKKLETFFIVHV